MPTNISQRFPLFRAFASIFRFTRFRFSPIRFSPFPFSPFPFSPLPFTRRAAKHNFLTGRSALVALVLALFLVVGAPSVKANDQAMTFKTPPVKIPLNIKDQQVTIVASALITMRAKEQGTNILKLELTADLGDLQQNMTGVLGSELDKEDRCGDHIAIQNATLTPLEPASVVVVQLHYERWVCAKVFGKQEVRKVIAGNAVIQMKLTPAVEANKTELRLVPEVGPIQADGSLGELLRSGTLGDMLREKIRTAILSAMQKGTNLDATLPPAIQGYATIRDARFKDGGAGRLVVILAGEVHATHEQLQALSKEVKERVGSK